MKFKFTLEPSYFWTNQSTSASFDGPDYDVVVCGFELLNGQRLTFRFLGAVLVAEHRLQRQGHERCTFYLQQFAHNWTLSLSQGAYHPVLDLVYADHVEILEPAGIVKTPVQLHTLLECLADDVIGQTMSQRVAPGHWEGLATARPPNVDECSWFA